MARVSCKWGRTHFRVRRSTYCYCCSLLEWQMNFSSCNWYEIDKISRNWLLLLLAVENRNKKFKKEIETLLNQYLHTVNTSIQLLGFSCMSNTERRAVFKRRSPRSFLLQKIPAPPFATFFIDIRSALSVIFVYIGKKEKLSMGFKRIHSLGF